MTPLILAASILLNPSHVFAYVPGTILQWESAPGAYVSALAFVDRLPGIAPTIETQVTGPTLFRFADKDVWTFDLDSLKGQGCRAQFDFYGAGATFFHPTIANLVDLRALCVSRDVPRDPETPSSVPEPSTWLSLFAGVLAVLYLRRQR